VSSSQEQTLSGTGARVGRGDGYQCSLYWGLSSINKIRLIDMATL